MSVTGCWMSILMKMTRRDNNKDPNKATRNASKQKIDWMDRKITDTTFK